MDEWQAEREFHTSLAWGVIYLSAPIFLLLLLVVPSPWGKTASLSSLPLGPLVSARPAWFFFECPNLVWSWICWHKDMDLVNEVLLGLFVLHYVQRAIVYPLRMSPQTKPMPLGVVVSAFSFTCINGYLQAQSLCRFQSLGNHLFCGRVILGLALFVVGAGINLHSDSILRQLRQQRSKEYQIPQGGLFGYITAPHYAGEIMEWTGFAVASNNSLAAWSFVAFTVANLVPRAVAHHTWYRRNFPVSYPKRRRAIIPFVW